MTTSAPSGHTHPLITAYLTDLERALTHADPQERADTLAAVREHIEDALDGAAADKAAAMAVLSDLGPVERIAATATPAPTAPGATNTAWIAPTLLISSIASLALVIAVPWIASAIALGTLVAALIQIRRTTGRLGLLRASAVLSIATLLTTALMAFFLLGTTTNTITNDDVQTVQPNDG